MLWIPRGEASDSHSHSNGSSSYANTHNRKGYYNKNDTMGSTYSSESDFEYGHHHRYKPEYSTEDLKHSRKSSYRSDAPCTPPKERKQYGLPLHSRRTRRVKRDYHQRRRTEEAEKRQPYNSQYNVKRAPPLFKSFDDGRSPKAHEREISVPMRGGGIGQGVCTTNNCGLFGCKTM
mmetsp:Transcript_10037/g.13981  ORF Transcript_10037/g.13981 Transcript_10037/m.13981 type:complete len:176 (-) Transcript_10037:298-825(-)|eukprot:CAMPEP_0184504658 /NCGR_PEP_ID=MMETSP0113_2-20130426/52453_1 /TAXON_ID=91329 /ORGANISM="Norrisiella sphaerica, Strain BC52" /LENGTH=175 /DNA_ID=CAMNT_0026894313 /DNA_START=227 /DNA_END=754 /DNA_ORIENTATION=-